MKKQKLVFVFFICMAIVCSCFLYLEFDKFQKNVIYNYEKQEQEMLSIYADLLFQNENIGTKEWLVDIENVLISSGSYYYFVAQNNEMLFLKDNETTQSMGAFTEWDYFQKKIVNMNVSCVVNTYENGQNIICLGKVIETDYILKQTGIMRFELYAVLAYIFLVLIFIATIQIYMISIQRMKRYEGKIQTELIEKNMLLHASEDENSLTQETDDLVCEMVQKSEDNLYRQYRMNFYLNATHFIYIDGQKGMEHPHTWELTVHLLCTKAQFVAFHKVETTIDNYLEKYQDKCLNEVSPFQKINPTLENCCHEFMHNIEGTAKELGFVLLEMELRESPSRTYIINRLRENK